MITADSDRIDEALEAAGEAQEDTVQVTAQRPKNENGSACSNCHQPLPEKKSTVCPHCGYYFSLGICIELDQTWERLAGVQAINPSKSNDQGPPKSWMKDWASRWGRKLIAAVRRSHS